MELLEEYNALIEQGKHDEAEKLRSEALKEAAQYMKNGLSVDEAMQKGRLGSIDKQKAACEEAEKHMKNGLLIIESLQKMGLLSGDALKEVIKGKRKENPYFPYQRPFSRLKKEDEEIDGLLRVKGYNIDTSLSGYYEELKTHHVRDLLEEIGIAPRWLLEILNAVCDGINANSTNPLLLQNEIKKILDVCDENAVTGQIVQILLLQGLIYWFENSSLNEKDEGYKDAKAFCLWVYDRHREVCVFYFMNFGEMEELKPLSDYLLANSETGQSLEYIEQSKQPQPDTTTRQTQIQKGKLTQKAVNKLHDDLCKESLIKQDKDSFLYWFGIGDQGNRIKININWKDFTFTV
jgi:hypothetical protein